MWDLLVTLGTVSFIPGLLPTILSRRTYIPRVTSAVSVFGLLVIIVGLVGSGLIMAPIVTGASAAVWAFIFLFRGTPPPHHPPLTPGEH